MTPNELILRGDEHPCAHVLAHRQALWTFVAVEGVEPTNHRAERELRAFVS